MNDFAALQEEKRNLKKKRDRLHEEYDFDWYSKSINRGDYLFLTLGGGLLFIGLYLGKTRLLFSGGGVVTVWALVRLGLEYLKSKEQSKYEADKEKIDSSISEIVGEIEGRRREWEKERERRRRRRKRENRKKKKWWLSLSSRQFEEEIGELYELNGWNVRLTPESNDGGYDLKIRSGESTYLVECKQRQLDSDIGRPSVQKLAGAVVGENADKGLLVTNSGFTSRAKSFAKRADVELVDGDDLLRIAMAA